MNGIGPLARQFVHDRNAARPVNSEPAGDHAHDADGDQHPSATSGADTAHISPAALAHFEAWKARKHDAQDPAHASGRRPAATPLPVAGQRMKPKAAAAPLPVLGGRVPFKPAAAPMPILEQNISPRPATAPLPVTSSDGDR